MPGKGPLLGLLEVERKNTGPGLKAHVADPWERLHRRPASHLVSPQNSDTAPGSLDQLHVTSKLQPEGVSLGVSSRLKLLPLPQDTHTVSFSREGLKRPRKPPGRS